MGCSFLDEESFVIKWRYTKQYLSYSSLWKYDKHRTDWKWVYELKHFGGKMVGKMQAEKNEEVEKINLSTALNFSDYYFKMDIRLVQNWTSFDESHEGQWCWF